MQLPYSETKRHQEQDRGVLQSVATTRSLVSIAGFQGRYVCAVSVRLGGTEESFTDSSERDVFVMIG